MMRKPRRLAVALAVSGLVAAGAVAASQLANADVTQYVAGTCSGFTGGAFCTVTATITAPTSISISVLASPKQFATFNYTLQCTKGGQSGTTSGSDSLLSPPTGTVTIDMPFTNPDSCNITVNGNIPTERATNRLTVTVSYTTAPIGSSSGPVSIIRGFGNMCLDAKGNSSANGTPVLLWSCNSSDSAQGWTFSSGELKHNGKCANDQGNGGSGTKVILWSCTGGSNERWFHTTSGEFILSLSTHGLLCLNDPGNSRTNGTRVIVYHCNNRSNEHWSVG
jgi:hypothetical protein